MIDVIDEKDPMRVISLLKAACAAVIFTSGAFAPSSVVAENARGGSPFDGRWRIDYSCKNATGLYADRCAAGDRDYLELNIAVRAGKICGAGEATAQLENREGGAEIVGTVKGLRAWVKWEALGAHGNGELNLRGRTVVFHMGAPTPDDDSGWSFPPPSTIVLSKKGAADPTLVSCSTDIPA